MKWAKASTAKSFSPPVPPSATDLAKADGIRLFYWIAGGLLLFALLLARGQHYKAAAIAGGGAVLVPLVGNFVSEVSALWTGAIIVGISATLFAAWYLVRGRLKEPVAPAKIP